MLENKTEAQTTPETQPEDNGVQSERKFTQEEVNRIVQDRLAKDRTKSERTQQEHKDQAQKDLAARESRLDCREYLIDKDYPKELLDCIDTSNPEEFKTKVEAAFRAITYRTPREPAPLKSTEDYIYDNLGSAFEYGRKHEPKQFPPRPKE